MLQTGETNLVVISSRDAVKEVMQTHDENFADHPVLYATNVLMYGSTDIAFSNGLHWRHLRRISISELFTSKQVKIFSSIRKSEIYSLLKNISLVSGETPINLSVCTYELSNNIISHTAFGGQCKMSDVFLEILEEIMEILSVFQLSDQFPSLSWLDVKMKRKVARIHSKMDLVLRDIVHEHLKNREQQGKRDDKENEYDFIDVLINVKETADLELPITIDNIKAIILDLFIGTASIATTISWAMTELIKHIS